jgi:hypothetical protein
MERGTHWILWLILIILFVLVFPKSCGYKITSSEENQNIITDDNKDITNYDESVLYDENNSDESIYDENISDEIMYDETNSDETIYDENISDEELYDENPSMDEPSLEGEMPTLIRNSADTQEYKCYGLLDGLIAKINSNSSIQWCYGICLINKEKIGTNNKIQNKTKDNPFISEMISNFSSIAIVLSIIIGAIIIIGIIKNILNKLKTVDK